MPGNKKEKKPKATDEEKKVKDKSISPKPAKDQQTKVSKSKTP